MITNQLSKRELNKITIKKSILDNLLAKLVDHKINEINLIEICDAAKVSKVTFFNYFSSKEQVLEYFIYSWQYNVGYVMEANGIKGKEAIKHIFDSIVKEPFAINVLHALDLHILKQEDQKHLDVYDYDYYSFNKEAFRNNYQQKGICELFKQALSQTSLDANGQTTNLYQLLNIFYGAPILLTETNMTLKDYYDKMVNHILKDIR